jgi:sugar lactone lactonase YvrE
VRRRATLDGLNWGCMLLVCAGGCSDDPPKPPARTEAVVAPLTPTGPVRPADIRVEGFATPECALYDAATDTYLVSNVNGSPVDLDDNGFISRVTPDGKISTLKWIDGASPQLTLNAPKGMAIGNGVLFVADIDVVRRFDASSGAPLGELAIPGATFLNDVAASGDEIVVSDTGAKLGTKGLEPTGSDAIYRIRGDELTTLIKSAELGQPNGLWYEESGIWVVTFGSGELYRVVDGQRKDVNKLPFGPLDGLVRVADGELLLSSWGKNSVFKGKENRELTTELEAVETPADLGYDTKRNRLLVPLFQRDTLVIHALGP